MPISVAEYDTSALDMPTLDRLHALLQAAFDGDFHTTDFDHALGGRHFLVWVDGGLVAHASVVPRTLYVRERALACGYVEAVATARDHRGRGLGTAVLRAASTYIAANHDLGALSTGEHAFYERVGWVRWRGPTFVRTERGLVRTPEDDDALMVLSPRADLDLCAPIACERRDGDVW